MKSRKVRFNLAWSCILIVILAVILWSFSILGSAVVDLFGG